MDDCLFCKIVSGEIRSDCVFEDEEVYAFRDINPQAPTRADRPKEAYTLCGCADRR